jgi:hypothetical protein
MPFDFIELNNSTEPRIRVALKRITPNLKLGLDQFTKENRRKMRNLRKSFNKTLRAFWLEKFGDKDYDELEAIKLANSEGVIDYAEQNEEVEEVWSAIIISRANYLVYAAEYLSETTSEGEPGQDPQWKAFDKFQAGDLDMEAFEILRDLIESKLGLNPVKEKNSELPLPSTEQAWPTNPPTTATHVDETEATKSETVRDSSLPANVVPITSGSQKSSEPTED